MGKKFVQRQRARDLELNAIVSQWSSQIMLDAVTITLNNPAVMGKGVFGRQRLLKLLPAICEAADETHKGLEKRDDASYTRQRTDERLKAILGDAALPWQRRYKDFPDDRPGE